MNTAIISLGLLAVVGARPFINPNPWSEVADDDGVKVWAREVPNSNIREVKAEAEFDVPSTRVWEVLLDVAHYVEFMPYVAETRVVGTAGPRARYIYQRLDPPIIDDRDYTLLVSGEANDSEGLYFLDWVPANKKGPPEQEDTVRVTTCKGSWTIEPLAGGKTHATYYVFTDPGGYIPTWIVNIANTQSVPDMMAAIHNRAKNPRWRRD